ncbi:MAG: hypothetical protein ACP5L0_07340, partial [Caldisphaera sp.]|uniref:hypothetical protein n=1 Tax=Caldisphaera sp. TaxID=2060322 RepID=UPI003D109F60
MEGRGFQAAETALLPLLMIILILTSVVVTNAILNSSHNYPINSTTSTKIIYGSGLLPYTNFVVVSIKQRSENLMNYAISNYSQVQPYIRYYALVNAFKYVNTKSLINSLEEIYLLAQKYQKLSGQAMQISGELSSILGQLTDSSYWSSLNQIATYIPSVQAFVNSVNTLQKYSNQINQMASNWYEGSSLVITYTPTVIKGIESIENNSPPPPGFLQAFNNETNGIDLMNSAAQQLSSYINIVQNTLNSYSNMISYETQNSVLSNIVNSSLMTELQSSLNVINNFMNSTNGLVSTIASTYITLNAIQGRYKTNLASANIAWLNGLYLPDVFMDLLLTITAVVIVFVGLRSIIRQNLDLEHIAFRTYLIGLIGILMTYPVLARSTIAMLKYLQALNTIEQQNPHLIQEMIFHGYNYSVVELPNPYFTVKLLLSMLASNVLYMLLAFLIILFIIHYTWDTVGLWRFIEFRKRSGGYLGLVVLLATIFSIIIITFLYWMRSPLISLILDAYAIAIAGTISYIILQPPAEHVALIKSLIIYTIVMFVIFSIILAFIHLLIIVWLMQSLMILMPLTIMSIIPLGAYRTLHHFNKESKAMKAFNYGFLFYGVYWFMVTIIGYVVNITAYTENNLHYYSLLSPLNFIYSSLFTINLNDLIIYSVIISIPLFILMFGYSGSKLSFTLIERVSEEFTTSDRNFINNIGSKAGFWAMLSLIGIVFPILIPIGIIVSSRYLVKLGSQIKESRVKRAGHSMLLLGIGILILLIMPVVIFFLFIIQNYQYMSNIKYGLFVPFTFSLSTISKMSILTLAFMALAYIIFALFLFPLIFSIALYHMSDGFYSLYDRLNYKGFKKVSKGLWFIGFLAMYFLFIESGTASIIAYQTMHAKTNTTILQSISVLQAASNQTSLSYGNPIGTYIVLIPIYVAFLIA